MNTAVALMIASLLMLTCCLQAGTTCVRWCMVFDIVCKKLQLLTRRLLLHHIFSLGLAKCAVLAQVSQLAGYVSEHSAYHHGDVSLTSTIVGMAQNFVGSNNVNLLYPSGPPSAL